MDPQQNHAALDPSLLPCVVKGAVAASVDWGHEHVRKAHDQVGLNPSSLLDLCWDG